MHSLCARARFLTSLDDRTYEGGSRRLLGACDAVLRRYALGYDRQPLVPSKLKATNDSVLTIDQQTDISITRIDCTPERRCSPDCGTPLCAASAPDCSTAPNCATVVKCMGPPDGDHGPWGGSPDTGGAGQLITGVDHSHSVSSRVEDGSGRGRRPGGGHYVSTIEGSPNIDVACPDRKDIVPASVDDVRNGV